MRLWGPITTVALALALAACTKHNPNYCADANIYNNCAFDAGAPDRPELTEVGDATDAADVADAAEDTSDGADAVLDLLPEKPMCTLTSCGSDTPICDVDAGTCGGCQSSAECKARDSTTPGCDLTDHKCYPCAASTDCATATTPICDAHACRVCRADAECGGAGICLDSGACATDSQVVFVDFNASGCPGATGTSASPFCSPVDAVSAVAAGKGPVIILRGPASDPFAFDTALPSPVLVVGRKNAAGEAPTITLGVLSGVHVSTGTVQVRDLNIQGGSAASAKGVVAVGANAVVTLRRLTIDTGTGLGIAAQMGATLTVDQCVVKDNAVGGLLVDSSAYDVTNSVFATSGYGVRFSSPKTTPTPRFVFNTVVGNLGNATTCDPSSPQTLTGGIIVGFNDSCTISNSLTTAPTFDTARPFHLTAHAACPMGTPANAPAYDIDGDPRVAPVDCGADQFK
jgi:hypothetical protein